MAFDRNDKMAINLFKFSLAKILGEQDIKAIDGHFNYFITKLLKDLKWCNGEYFKIIGSPTYTKVHDFLLDVFKEVYPPKYFNYNRLIGMLVCCREEFKRRYGKHATAPHYLLSSLVSEIYGEIIGPYEDGKIEANGDV